MKKTFLSTAVLLLFLSFALTGCSSGKSASDPGGGHAFDWLSPDRTVGSVDIEANITNCTESIPFHIEYSVPLGYEAVFPKTWAVSDPERYSERAGKIDPGTPDRFQMIHDVELMRGDVLVFAIDFLSKPAYYESYLRVMAMDLLPREDASVLYGEYYYGLRRVEKDGRLYTVAASVSVQSEKETIGSRFALVDLLSSEKMAASMYVASDDTSESLLSYAEWFTINVLREPEEPVRGMIRTEDDPVPTQFSKQTLENGPAKINVGYYLYEGYTITFSRQSDPKAENDLEVYEGEDLKYRAKIISKDEMRKLQEQYQSDPDFTEADLAHRGASDLRKVGKIQTDFRKEQSGGPSPVYFTLIDFTGSDTAALFCEQRWPDSDGTVKGSAFPYFYYSLAD